MKKKLCLAFVISIIFALAISVSASAITPRWSYIHSIGPSINYSNNTYNVTATATDDVKRIDVTVTLYEKLSGGATIQVDSFSGYEFGSVIYREDSYNFQSGKTYKTETRVTVTTYSGHTETAVVSYPYN